METLLLLLSNAIGAFLGVRFFVSPQVDKLSKRIDALKEECPHTASKAI